jgi:hypothetical protein
MGYYTDSGVVDVKTHAEHVVVGQTWAEFAAVEIKHVQADLWYFTPGQNS